MTAKAPGSVSSFKDLIVGQRAQSATLRCIRLANQTRRSLGSEVVLRQTIAATSSVGANIAEGYGRRNGAEYLRFLEIAYGSACEAENWVLLIQEASIGPPEDWVLVQTEILEVQRMLATMMSRLRERTGRGGVVRESAEPYEALDP